MRPGKERLALSLKLSQTCSIRFLLVLVKRAERPVDEINHARFARPRRFVGRENGIDQRLDLSRSLLVEILELRRLLGMRLRARDLRPQSHARREPIPPG